MENKTLILIKLCISLTVSIIISSLIIKYLIKKEKKNNIGQYIKDDIVSSHKLKEKTPTMGGIGIFISTWITSLIFGYEYIDNPRFVSLFIISISYFFVGLIDEQLKLKNKNGRGLKGIIRLILEITTVIFILYYLGYEQHSLWKLYIFNFKALSLGALFIPFVIFIVVGGANSVNMADGLDGLAGGLMMMGLAPFLIVSLINMEYGISIFLISLIGSLFGFLLFNYHPAKIFMGDVGSLPLGGVLAMTSFLLNKEALLIISGGIFIFETISVIVQVSYYKMTKKRVFLMAPFHHHLELKGLNEASIVMIFYIIGFVLSILATFIGVTL